MNANNLTEFLDKLKKWKADVKKIIWSVFELDLNR
jgi:hypothetical protein